MIGQAGEQRAARHLADSVDLRLQSTFLAQRAAEKGDERIVQPAREVEKDGVLPEIGDGGGVEAVDGGIGPPAQQRHPMVVGAHMHPALVAAQIEHLVVAMPVRRRVDLGALVLQAVDVDGAHVANLSSCSPVAMRLPW